MACPKFTKQVPHSGPLFPVGGPSLMALLRSFPYIIKLLVGQSPHHLKNTQHFIQQLQSKRLEPGETITSYDVKALFTSVPVQPSIQIVKQRLQQDNTLPQRTSMSISQITSLLEFCLTHIYFLFQGKYYEQVQGAAMGSQITSLLEFCLTHIYFLFQGKYYEQVQGAAMGSQITSLLEFCLTHIYFLFQGKYYEQVQGAAMGSPISPLIANIFMEEF